MAAAWRDAGISRQAVYAAARREPPHPLAVELIELSRRGAPPRRAGVVVPAAPPAVKPQQDPRTVDVPADVIERLDRLALGTLGALAKGGSERVRYEAARELARLAERRRAWEAQTAPEDREPAPPSLRILTDDEVARRLAL